MKLAIIAGILILIGSAAYAGGFMMLHVGSADGGSVAPLTNLRITNVPDFRVTNTGDNRAVSP